MDATYKKHFVAADYIVFGLTILVSLLIGLIFAFKDRNDSSTENYFLGNRRLHVLPVTLSFLVTFESSILILGYSAEVYVHGLSIIWVHLGLAVAILLATRITVNMFHPLKITSVFEYFQLRYQGNSVRYMTMTFGTLYYVFYMGLVLYGPALAIESVTGIAVWVTIVCFTVVATLYTAIGGIKAVIWTDVFQFLVMTTGIFSLLIKGTMDAGGLSNVFSTGNQYKRLDIFNFNPNPFIRHSFWTVSVGSITQWLYMTLNQSTVQRLNSTPTISDARKVLYLSIPLFAIIQIAAMFQGLVAFAKYAEEGCDPLASKQIDNMNQIVPFTILDLFSNYPGFPGLFIAALSAASLSTVSSGLSSLSAVTCEDIVKVFFPEMSHISMVTIAKLFVVLYGLIAASIAFVMSYIEGPFQQIFISCMASISGPTSGVFLLSIFFRRATQKGAMAGGICGFFFLLWICLGFNFSKTLQHTPYLPPGPTDKCPADNITMSYIANRNASFDSIPGMDWTTRIHVTESPKPDWTTEQHVTVAPQGFDKLYSISYMYFSLIGTLISLLVGIVVSLLTKGNIPDSEYVLDIVEQFCCCFGRFRRHKTNAEQREMDNSLNQDDAAVTDKMLNSTV